MGEGVGVGVGAGVKDGGVAVALGATDGGADEEPGVAEALGVAVVGAPLDARGEGVVARCELELPGVALAPWLACAGLAPSAGAASLLEAFGSGVRLTSSVASASVEADCVADAADEAPGSAPAGSGRMESATMSSATSPTRAIEPPMRVARSDTRQVFGHSVPCQ